MKIPTYLDNKENVIILRGNQKNNKSNFNMQDNLISLHGSASVFIYIGDWDEKAIELDLFENSNIKLYLIIKSSKSANYEFKFNLNNSAKLDVFTNIKNTEIIDTTVKRVYDLADSSALNIHNALLNMGKTNLTEYVNLNKDNANVNIDLLNIGSYNEEYNITQDVFHNAKSTISNINNSLISNSNSKLKYSVSGRIFKGNEFSICNQINKGIILNEFGEIEVEPKLYIDEYNVEASHGAAIGQMDDEQLYYLLSRGLTDLQARSLIISGYTKPFINSIEDEDVQLMIERQILKKINEVDVL
ncbi:SufD family Fe-S cluster assembly protein [Mycoplasmatota bacterium WC30]